MDRFFVKKDCIDYVNNKLYISGEDVKHISKVLRHSIGDKIEVCDCENSEYICEISDISKEKIDLNIKEKIEINRESNIKIRLYQGMPKNTKMEIILQKLTECGVSEIILVDTDRSIVNIDNKKSDKKFERWERIVYESAKQCKRGIIPVLRGVLSFEEAIKDMKKNDINISPYEEEYSLGIKEVLGDESICSIVDKKRSLNEVINVGIFVGSEGGFTEKENSIIKKNGIKSVKMGPRIFRTETASIVATAIVQYELGDIGVL